MAETREIQLIRDHVNCIKKLLINDNRSAVTTVIQEIEASLDTFSKTMEHYCDEIEKVSHLESLINASRILNSTLDLKELLTRFMDIATKEMKADRSTLYLIDKQKNELWSLIAQGTDMVEIRLPIGQGIAGKVAESGEAVNIDNVYDDPRFYREIDRKIGYVTRNMLCLPVRNKNEDIIGVIQILNKLQGFFTKEDEYFLENLSLQAAIAIENAQLYQESLERKRLEAELRVAYDIQKNLLPSKSPNVRGLQICGLNIPCFEVGGDYYDFISLDGALGIAIGDVSGKGIPASLIMANLQAALRALAPTSKSTEDIVLKMNTLLKKSSGPNKFVTFFYSIYDTTNQSLRFTNAGHNPPILLRESQAERYLSTEGLMMGAFDDAVFNEDLIQLQDQDVLVFYTDGITERLNVDHEHYGETRLINIVRQYKKDSAESIKEAIISDITDFAGDIPSGDDVTLIVMKIDRL